MGERGDGERVGDAELDARLDAGVRAVLADPVPMSEEAFAAGRARVLAVARGSSADGAAGGGVVGGRGWRARRWVAVAAGVVVVAGVAGIPVSGEPPVAGAAETLTKAAVLVVGAQDPVPAPGQFHYSRTRDWALAVDDRAQGRFRHLHEGVRETWRPRDWRAEWLSRYTITGKRQWVEGTEADARAAGVDLPGPSTTERRAPCGDFVPELGETGPCFDVDGHWDHPTEAFLAGLPRDPVALHRMLVEAAGDRPGGAMGLAADVLATGLVPADLRAALYQALAKLPDLVVSDRAANLDGDIGVALRAGDGGQVREIVIDPSTGRFLGERLIATREWEGLPAGTVWSFTAVSTGVADAAGTPPR